MAFWNRRRKSSQTIQKMFEGFLSPESIAEVLKPAAGKPRSVEEGDIHFILCQFEDKDLAEMRSTMSGIIDLSLFHGGVVVDICPSFVFVTFGFPRSAFRGQDNDDFARSRTALAKALLDTHGRRIRAVHGCSYGSFGALGSERRFNYGPLFSGFNRVIDQLVSSEFGTLVEIQKTE